MRQAVLIPTTKLSSLIRDPDLRAIFERAERDYGQSFAIPSDPGRVLDGGAAEPTRVRVLEMA